MPLFVFGHSAVVHVTLPPSAYYLADISASAHSVPIFPATEMPIICKLLLTILPVFQHFLHPNMYDKNLSGILNTTTKKKAFLSTALEYHAEVCILEQVSVHTLFQTTTGRNMS